MDRLRDHIWLWGHPEGRYNHEYGNEKESRMTPLEGILYLGGRNTFMVPVGVDVNRRQYNKSFRPLRRVGWDVTGAGQNPDVVNRLIDESREFANIDCAVFDDFVSGGRYRDIPLENLFEVNRRLPEDGPRPLAMWMVLYTREFGLDADADAASTGSSGSDAAAARSSFPDAGTRRLTGVSAPSRSSQLREIAVFSTVSRTPSKLAVQS